LDFLYGSEPATGRRLRAKGWTCPIVPASRVESHAQELAASLATKSRDALRLLKQHLTRRLVALVGELTRIAPDSIAVTPQDVLVVDVRNFDEIRGAHKAAVLVIDDVAYAEDVLAGARQAIAESRSPVIAVLERSSVNGNGWILAPLCDAFVHARSAPAVTWRFGNGLAVEADRARSTAVQLATAWSKLAGGTRLPMPAEQAAEAADPLAAPTPIASTNVITATAYPDGIVRRWKMRCEEHVFRRSSITFASSRAHGEHA
jgi:hypothetical protein